MAGLGFLLFVFPALLGGFLAVFLSIFRRGRPFAPYALFVPLLGVVGAWKGLNAGFAWADPYLQSYMYGLSHSRMPADIRIFSGLLLGGIVGIATGALIGRGFNRLLRRKVAVS
jgi:hypothetical protein